MSVYCCAVTKERRGGAPPSLSQTPRQPLSWAAEARAAPLHPPEVTPAWSRGCAEGWEEGGAQADLEEERGESYGGHLVCFDFGLFKKQKAKKNQNRTLYIQSQTETTDYGKRRDLRGTGKRLGQSQYHILNMGSQGKEVLVSSGKSGVAGTVFTAKHCPALNAR